MLIYSDYIGLVWYYPLANVVFGWLEGLFSLSHSLSIPLSLSILLSSLSIYLYLPYLAAGLSGGVAVYEGLLHLPTLRLVPGQVPHLAGVTVST